MPADQTVVQSCYRELCICRSALPAPEIFLPPSMLFRWLSRTIDRQYRRGKGIGSRNAMLAGGSWRPTQLRASEMRRAQQVRQTQITVHSSIEYGTAGHCRRFAGLSSEATKRFRQYPTYKCRCLYPVKFTGKTILKFRGRAQCRGIVLRETQTSSELARSDSSYGRWFSSRLYCSPTTLHSALLRRKRFNMSLR